MLNSNPQIPEEFTPFFWDVYIEQLEPAVHSKFIIERLLNEGDHHALQWLFSTYSKDDILQTVRSSRNLSRKTARYWQLYFDLKEEEMRCFGMSLTKPDNLF